MNSKFGKEYRDKYYSNIEGKFCACGKPATKSKYRMWTCDECDKLDSKVQRWHDTWHQKRKELVSEEALTDYMGRG